MRFIIVFAILTTCTPLSRAARDPFENLEYVKNELIWHNGERFVAGEFIDVQDPGSLDIYKKAVIDRACKYVYLLAYYSMYCVMDIHNITPSTLTNVFDCVEAISQYTKERFGRDSSVHIDLALDALNLDFYSLSETACLSVLNKIGQFMVNQFDGGYIGLGMDVYGMFNLTAGKKEWEYFYSITNDVLDDTVFPPGSFRDARRVQIVIITLKEKLRTEYKLSKKDVESMKLSLENVFNTENVE